MHINDTDLISVGLHMKTVKQITGIWFGKQARMVMILSVTHRKNIFSDANDLMPPADKTSNIRINIRRTA